MRVFVFIICQAKQVSVTPKLTAEGVAGKELDRLWLWVERSKMRTCSSPRQVLYAS